ncbi:MAG: hypothetical protein F6J87_30060 [Spirulina sp. SIO3F2]|nr:hypothetical protein [Spirulina sp. SIO3F2]
MTTTPNESPVVNHLIGLIPTTMPGLSCIGDWADTPDVEQHLISYLAQVCDFSAWMEKEEREQLRAFLSAEPNTELLNLIDNAWRDFSRAQEAESLMQKISDFNSSLAALRSI